jgi:hypothetical protein
MRLERKIALPIRQQPDDLWEQLLALAQRAEPATKKQFLEALVKLNGNLDVGAIEDALSRGDIAAVVDAIPWDELKEALESIETALEDVRSRAFELSRGAAEPHLDPQQLAIHLGERSTLAIGWRHVSSFVLDAIRARTGDRITQVTDETRAAVRQLVERTYSEGGHARTMIPAIRQTIGLTSRQERAVRAMKRRCRWQAAGRSRRSHGRALSHEARQESRGAHRAHGDAAGDERRAARAWSTLVERGLLDEPVRARMAGDRAERWPHVSDLHGSRRRARADRRQYAGWRHWTAATSGLSVHGKVVPIEAPVDNDADVAVG